MGEGKLEPRGSVYQVILVSPGPLPTSAEMSCPGGNGEAGGLFFKVLLGIELGRRFLGKKIGSQNCFQLPVFILVGGNGFEPSTSGM